MKIRFFFVLLIFAIFVSCSNGKNKVATVKNKAVINIAGSTSVMPFTEKLAEYFMVLKPEYIVNVQSGGSTAGIQACLNKTVDIGMSSRELKDDEKILNEIPICYDGIAIVVNSANEVKDLSIEQIKGIFEGRIKNWKELGWINRKIDAVTREEGSGTRGAFEELVMGKSHIDDAIMVQDSNGSVKEVVRTDPYAIGYISLGMVDEKVKSVTVDGVAATVKNIKEKKYKIVRPFLYLTNGKPSEHAQVFIDFVLSKEGQNILKKEGLVPVND
ncbi:MAG: phosphate ABC transporter substrate-binding protein [bacterium]